MRPLGLPNSAGALQDFKKLNSIHIGERRYLSGRQCAQLERGVDKQATDGYVLVTI